MFFEFKFIQSMPGAYSPYDVFDQNDSQDGDTVTPDAKTTKQHAQRNLSEQQTKSDPIFNFLSCTAHTCTLATIICFFIFVYWLSMLYFLPIVRKADELADKAILLVDDASSQLVFVDEARSKLVFFESMAVNISDLATINNNRAAGLEVEMKTSLAIVNLLSDEAEQTLLESNKLVANSADFLETTSKATNATLLKVSVTLNNVEDMTIQLLSQVNKTFTQRNADLLTIIHDAHTIIHELNKTLFDLKKSNEAVSQQVPTESAESYNPP